jgi:hypothetical protein
MSEPDALMATTLALESCQHHLGWDQPARLFGIAPDHTWVMVDEGDPYDIVELFSLLPGESFIAVALVVEGWGSPPGRTRPSRHPRRERLRVTVSVARDGSHVSLLRRRGGEPEVVPDDDGGGELMGQLLTIWDRVAAAEN